jgi:hypothetical protein
VVAVDTVCSTVPTTVLAVTVTAADTGDWTDARGDGAAGAGCEWLVPVAA